MEEGCAIFISLWLGFSKGVFSLSVSLAGLVILSSRSGCIIDQRVMKGFEGNSLVLNNFMNSEFFA